MNSVNYDASHDVSSSLLMKMIKIMLMYHYIVKGTLRKNWNLEPIK
jgi:hypothetical protein